MSGGADPVAVHREVAARTGRLAASSPDVMGAFARLHVAARRPGALATSVKELMSLAIAIAVGCEDCIGFHLREAVAAGASREEVLETLGVAVMMGGGPAVVLAGVAGDGLDALLPEDQEARPAR